MSLPHRKRALQRMLRLARQRLVAHRGPFLKKKASTNIFINFPDPWWKKKHQKRRIVSDVFAELLISRLKKGGHLFIQSDVASLLEKGIIWRPSNPGPSCVTKQESIGCSR